MWSEVTYPSATAYPDSDKVGVWTGVKPEDLIVERSATVDYYRGESAGGGKSHEVVIFSPQTGGFSRLRATRVLQSRNATPAGGIVSLCALAALPATAFGATANISIKRVWYAAGPAEVNDLTVSLSGADFLLSDPGAAIAATAPAPAREAPRPARPRGSSASPSPAGTRPTA